MDLEPRLSRDHEQASAERAMDALGAAERADMPPGLEDRVFASTAGTIGGAVRHAGGRDSGRGWRSAMGAGQRRGRVAVAAGLGAIVCLTAAWLALRGPNSGGGAQTPPIAEAGRSDAAPGLGTPSDVASIDLEVDAMFAASTLLGTGLDEEIALIGVEAASLGLDLADPITSDGLGGGLRRGTWSGESL